MFNHKLPADFPMQTLRKKTSPCKYKNEPGRFLGEGVAFRAKLIGVLEVPEARGDRMCQEALADLKMAIRAAGEHKQRIQVHVAIDGLRLRDDKTGDSLYHHPVHKISFIAQDMTDSRAFGYIFGSPDTGHRFFGIKTDKAASQVVIAMRDLFQVVFELKKKEVEMAKQQLEGKSTASSGISSRLQPLTVEAKLKYMFQSIAPESPAKPEAEGGVAELVDLEQELSSLRRGLTQVEGLTPSDPFGDSFIGTAQKGLLPPPPGSSSRGRAPPARPAPAPATTNNTTTTITNTTTTTATTVTLPFDLPVTTEMETPAPTVDSVTDVISGQQPSLGYDVFTDLDPLGTGRSKPYVDKKLFFQELKNPPKKVLKDLVPESKQTAQITEPDKPEFKATTTMTSLTRHSGGSVVIAKPPAAFSAGFFSSDPFAETDPFDNADPFSDSFKEDPFTGLAEFPKPPVKREKGSGLRGDVLAARLNSLASESSVEGSPDVTSAKKVFNGPLQVSLPPEPAPKSPRLTRQSTDSSSVRRRPQSRLTVDTASPPPLPPKKWSMDRAPPRPPHEFDDDVGPPLPKPARKKEKSSLAAASLHSSCSSSEEYVPRAPPPLPAARRLDLTLAHLLTCEQQLLADRLHVPLDTLQSMTLPQLTDYLRSYLAADNDRARIHVEPTHTKPEKAYTSLSPIPTLLDKPPVYIASSIDKPPAYHAPIIDKTPPYHAPPIDKPPSYNAPPISKDFKPQFEDNFTPPPDSSDTFVANFDDFDKKANSSYDRYAAFREIQEQELKSKSILDPIESPNGHVDTKQEEEKDEPSITSELTKADQEAERKEASKSPLKSLDELTLDSFNMFRNSVSPKPSEIDAKIEDIKSVMKTLQIEKTSRSVTPRENLTETKIEDNCDRYAALREITITEPSQDEFESIPPEIPKERKRSDEKSDGFDNSDFFDCIDNSSLSFSHVEDAFRKSPMVKEKEEEKKVEEARKSPIEVLPVRDLQPPAARLSTGSISDVASASSPETKACVVAGAQRWSVLGGRSPWSSDSRDSDTPRRRTEQRVQTSSSSRDVSPWEEPPRRPPSHTHSHRDSRHNSSGSRECLDSGSGREKDRRRSSRDRERETKDPRRDVTARRDVTRRRRDDIPPDRDRRRERDGDMEIERERDRRRERDGDIPPERERTYSRDRDYRESRSRERPLKEHREKERDRNRHRKSRHSYDENDDYSDGGSGRSSPRDRERWSERWRRDDRNYGSLGWRETRRRTEVRLPEDSDRRYGSTLTWSGRRREDRRRRRHSPRRHDARHDIVRHDVVRHDPRHDPDTPGKGYSDEYSPAPGKKRGTYSSLEGTRFSFDPDDPATPPLPAARDKWWYGGEAFEDDFTHTTGRRGTSIAEEDELPPLRNKNTTATTHKDIKKSESVNIFTRECDPFENDAFFACTGSDKAARRENWPGDFHGFNT